MDTNIAQDEEFRRRLQDDPKLAVQLVAELWEALTHCAKPAGFEETDQTLQEALRSISGSAPLPLSSQPRPEDLLSSDPVIEQDASNPQEALKEPESSAPLDEPAQQDLPIENGVIDSPPQPFSPKQLEWDSGVYQLVFPLSSDGEPIADPEWPIEFCLTIRPLPHNNGYFQVSRSAREAVLANLSNSGKVKFSTPEQMVDGHFVYRFDKNYRFGPKAYDEEGKYIWMPYQPPLSHFESGEHLLLGNSLMLRFSSTVTNKAADYQFTTLNNKKLTYGEINALGGDYFGTNTPISDGATPAAQQVNFTAAFNTLYSATGGDAEATSILALLAAEIKALSTITTGGTLSAATQGMYRQMSTDTKFLTDEMKNLDDATRKAGHPSFIALSQINVDHFGADAQKAYYAGHYCALKAAAAQNLDLAYMMNAFADHFLGDAFASGHIRTPRRKLHKGGFDAQKAANMIVTIAAGAKTTIDIGTAIAKELLDPKGMTAAEFLSMVEAAAPDYCSKYMHDEDNFKGLHVTNKGNSQQWMAYGDTKLFELANAQNRAFMQQALQISADEVYAAFNTKAAETDSSKYKAWDMTPRSVDSLNFSPLFNASGFYRSKIEDPTCTTYTDPDAQSTTMGWKTLMLTLMGSDYFKGFK